jgi:hypothetical protein
MRTGKTDKDNGPLATGIRFEKGRVIVELNDEREVSVPLKRYPTLKKARPAQRAAWKLIGPGKGFYWKSLDLDLSVRGIVSGLPEVIPAPPALKIKSVTRTRSMRGAA